jgi:hypothetical protein
MRREDNSINGLSRFLEILDDAEKAVEKSLAENQPRETQHPAIAVPKPDNHSRLRSG